MSNGRKVNAMMDGTMYRGSKEDDAEDIEILLRKREDKQRLMPWSVSWDMKRCSKENKGLTKHRISKGQEGRYERGGQRESISRDVAKGSPSALIMVDVNLVLLEIRHRVKQRVE